MARNRRLEDDHYVQGSDQEHSQVEGDETTPLDMVRYAMLQLENLSKNEILDDQHTIPNVTSMLQVSEFSHNILTFSIKKMDDNEIRASKSIWKMLLLPPSIVGS